MSRPLPTPSKISQPFWDSCKAGRMQLQRCDDCKTYVYYPAYVCPECASKQLSWTEVSGHGTVYSFTVAQRSSFALNGPLIVAVVELQEGPVMMTNLMNVAPEAVRIGLPVRVAYESASDDITLPMFEPG